MIYELSAVTDHGVYRLRLALDHFLETGYQVSPFGVGCFPDWFASALTRSKKLNEKLDTLWVRLNRSPPDRRIVQRLWRSLHKISDLCDGSEVIPNSGRLTKATKRAVADLFNFLYENFLRTSWCRGNCGDIRNHYRDFFERGNYICPFCGLECYPEPGSGNRAEYDHYLCRKYYPLLSISFDNLVPTCHTCNSGAQKGQVDCLHSAPNVRRNVYAPYGSVGGVEFSFSWEESPETGTTGKASIEFTPKNSAESGLIQTWLEIYKIKKRVRARIEHRYNYWLMTLIRHRRINTKPSVAELQDVFRQEADALNSVERIRTESDSLYKHGYFKYLAEDATPSELEGIAEIAPSFADVPIGVE